MNDILLMQLGRCAIFLIVSAGLLFLLIRIFQLKSAAMLRTIWGAVLIVSLLGFTIPIAVPILVPVEQNGPTDAFAETNITANTDELMQMQQQMPMPFGQPSPNVASETQRASLSKQTVPVSGVPLSDVSIWSTVSIWAASHISALLLIVWGLRSDAASNSSRERREGTS